MGVMTMKAACRAAPMALSTCQPAPCLSTAGLGGECCRVHICKHHSKLEARRLWMDALLTRADRLQTLEPRTLQQPRLMKLGCAVSAIVGRG